MQDTIEIRTEWIKTIANLADKASQELDNHEVPTSIKLLIGYASSAKTFINLSK